MKLKRIYQLCIISLFAPLSHLSAQCNTTIDNETYSSMSGWSANGAGAVSITGGVCNYNNAQCNQYDRIYRPLAYALSDNYFKADFKFTVVPNSSSVPYGANIIALTAGPLDPLTYDGSQSFAHTNQDGLIVLITCSTNSGNLSAAWLELEGKDGTTWTPGANTITLSASVLTYYCVLERVSATQVDLKVYTDAAHTNLYSQVSNTINATITGLNYLQNGATTPGGSARFFTGTVDDVTICDNALGVPEHAVETPLFEVYPNPAAGEPVTVEFINSAEKGIVHIYNSTGALVMEKPFAGSALTLDEKFAPGIYFIVAESGAQHETKKFIVE